MLRSAKAFVFLAILALGGAAAAPAAHAQNASGCPSADPTASDCLQLVNPDGSQLSLLAITEQDELDNPGKMWSISGVLPTNPAFLGGWIALTEPGTGAISDVVGIPKEDVLAFVSDPADFSGFKLITSIEESSSPLDITRFLSPKAQESGFKAFFQSDFEATVPEPSTWAMLLLGFAGLGFVGYRKARPAKTLAA
jgi:hypothetical protein